MTDADHLEPRLRRLREELVDDQVPLPVDGESGVRLLEELLYARQPPVHEGRAPRYGALVFTAGTARLPSKATTVSRAGTDLATLRQAADGRVVFVVSAGDAPDRLVCFDHTVEYESSLVRVQAETGALVVQRGAGGHVRICTDEGVVTWDGIAWTFKPGVDGYAAPLRRLLPHAPLDVLHGLLELCVHWLSAGRVGATLVWYVDGDRANLGGRIDGTTAVIPPALTLAERSHYGALLSLLGQIDRAGVVDVTGALRAVGLALAPSDEARRLVAPMGGTRHTSARQFSFDDPAAVVFVVSDDGPVTVFSDGAVAATIETNPCRSGFPIGLLSAADIHPDDELTVRCPTCARPLLVDVVRIAGWTGGPERLACPVCDNPVEIDAYRAVIRGVPKIG
ncbi:hypothetical protein BH20ACT2_BH20ACT2_10160 [soil metagenome]